MRREATEHSIQNRASSSLPYPRTGKVAVFKGQGQPFELIECEVPPLNPGEILVEVLFSTLCRSDVNTYLGKRIEKTPTILGHEIVGRMIAAAGEDPLKDDAGAPVNPGDRITWAIFGSDPEDEMSVRGIPQKAAGLFKYGHELLTEDSGWHGGLAEFCILRHGTPFLRLQEETPLEVASLINCAGATAAGAIRTAGVCRDRRILICGAGMLGIFAIAMLSEEGPQDLAAFDLNAERLAQSRAFGAKTTMDDLAKVTEPYDVIIDFTGDSSAIAAALDKLAIGGRCVLIGSTHPDDPISIRPEKLVRGLQTISGLHNYNAEDFKAAVHFVEAHHARFPFRELVYAGFTLDEVNEAFAATDGPAYRVGIYKNKNNTEE